MGTIALVLVWAHGSYEALAIADKACLRARVGMPAEEAKTHLRKTAGQLGVEIHESGERTSAVFRSLFSEAACTFVAREGKIVESRAGARALDAAR